MLKDLLSSGLFRALALKLIRQGATAGGVVVIAWLVKHNASQANAQDFVGYLVGAIVVGTSIIFDMLDGKNVSDKMAVTGATSYDYGRAQAAQQGADAQAAADQLRAKAVQAAISHADATSPKDKAELIASLRAGVGK